MINKELQSQSDADHTEKGFLATTALEEFWDTSKPIYFLEESPRRFSRRCFWKKFGDRVIKSPFDDQKVLLEARAYVDIAFEKLLLILTERLNRIHNVTHTTRYWRIVLGAWLYWYIAVMFERYSLLKKAFEDYPSLTTIGLSETSFVTASNTYDFNNMCLTDEYNLQIYTRILKYFGVDFPQKNINISKDFNKIKRSPLHKIFNKDLLSEIYPRLLQVFQGNGKINTKSTYFYGSVELILTLKTMGKIWPIRRTLKPILKTPYNKTTRAALNDMVFGENHFELLLTHLLPFDMPKSFIEDFDKIKRFVKYNFPSKPKAIFSSNGWYFQEEFKQWAALSAEHNTILIGTQHGGGYGSDLYLPEERFETEITDIYYTWGWEKLNTKAKIKPFYATKLVGEKEIGPNDARKGILFLSTLHTRYPIYILPRSLYYGEYIKWQLRFMNAVLKKLRCEIRARLHTTNAGIEIAEQWKSQLSDIFIEDWMDTPFIKSLIMCRISVFDHLSTTFLQALALNKPSILFCNPNHVIIRDEAKPFYEKLRGCGILFYCPEEAAHTLNNVYTDVEGWWNNPARQKVVKIFCGQFARSTSNSIEEWGKEIINIFTSNA